MAQPQVYARRWFERGPFQERFRIYTRSEVSKSSFQEPTYPDADLQRYVL